MLELTSENAFLVLKECLEENNSEKFEHSIRVARTSKILAKRWNVSVEDAVIAALLHDIGKSLTREEMLAFASIKELPIYDFEIWDNLAALHGRISAAMFESKFSNIDKNRFNSISHAISSHVAGDEYMSDLDKIIFVADNIEPDKSNDMLSRIKNGEIDTLDKCIEEIISAKRDKSIKKNRAYNPFLDATFPPSDQNKKPNSLDNER